MDREKVEAIFAKYPALKSFIAAGIVTLKAARTILDVDRWLMFDIYTQLLEAGAVVGTGSASWRASPALLEYLEEQRNGSQQDY